MQQDPAAAVDDEDAERVATGAAVRVLVVDDDADFRTMMTAVLDRTGDFVVVGEAGNGQEALVRARETAPDVVLLDVAMPVMGGLQALPALRVLCPDAALVMLTGTGATHSPLKEKATALGADGYVEKGQAMRGVLSGLYRVVNDKGLRRRLSTSS